MQKSNKKKGTNTAGTNSNEGDKHCEWMNLPQEVTLHILSFLNIKDVCRMSQVASWLHSLCCVDELWSSLLFNRSSPSSLALLLKDFPPSRT